MKSFLQRTTLPCALLTLLAGCATAPDAGRIAAKPLFRDPVHDGAADPSVIWNPHVQRWWLFYTNRRANGTNAPGVSWVQGTRPGIAESADGGTAWRYKGTAQIELPPAFGGAETTHWAPEVFTGRTERITCCSPWCRAFLKTGTTRAASCI